MSDLSDHDDRMSLSDVDEAQERREDEENAADGDGTGRRIDPSTSKKKIVRRPLPKLDVVRLKGPKGLRTIEKYFEGFKFHGQGHEAADLERIMKRLEHWAHRLYPKYRFDDFLEKVEHLGSKKELQTYLTKYRRDMLTDDQTDDVGEENVEEERYKSPEPVDEFDVLIAEQIERTRQVTSQSAPHDASAASADDIDDEVKQRMERNRQIALERKMARMRQKAETTGSSQSSQATNARPVTFAGPEDDLDMLIEEEMNSSADLTAVQPSREPPPAVDVEKSAELSRNEESEEEVKKRIERNRQMALERKMAKLRQKEAEQIAPVSQVESTNSSQKAQSPPEKQGESADVAISSENEAIAKILESPDAGEEKMAVAESTDSSETTPEALVKSKPTANAKRLLTEEELDDEIGAAVKMFARGNRSSV